MCHLSDQTPVPTQTPAARISLWTLLRTWEPWVLVLFFCMCCRTPWWLFRLWLSTPLWCSVQRVQAPWRSGLPGASWCFAWIGTTNCSTRRSSCRTWQESTAWRWRALHVLPYRSVVWCTSTTNPDASYCTFEPTRAKNSWLYELLSLFRFPLFITSQLLLLLPPSVFWSNQRPTAPAKYPNSVWT